MRRLLNMPQEKSLVPPATAATAGNESENAMANRSLGQGTHADTCVLVTGGAGFIGSHTCVELLDQGYRVVVVDDLSNSSEIALDRVRGHHRPGGRRRPPDVLRGQHPRSRGARPRLLRERHRRHHPLRRLQGRGRKRAEAAGVLLEQRRGHAARCATWRVRTACKNLVFSSSATVYGEPEFIPITEDCPKHEATNPYGQTKSMLEQVLTDLYVGDDEWNVVLLRYFNPIGAHESGLIGEDPEGHPQQPAALRGAGGRGQAGARGRVRRRLPHARTARACATTSTWWTLRAGTWRRSTGWAARWAPGAASTAGHAWPANRPATARAAAWASSTWEPARAPACSTWCMPSSAPAASELPYEIKPRRAGDIAENYAACDKAREELGWTARVRPRPHVRRQLALAVAEP